MNKDDKDKYIKQLEDKIAMFEARIQELERLLGINSQNSSKPPSSDGLGVPKPRKRGEVRRKRGAKKGHKPHIRKQFPPEEVTKFVPHEPHACTCGCQDLEECNEEPLRHQTVDIPPIKPVVIEHIQHVRKCKKCGELVYAPLPDDVRRNIFGPGVLSIVGILTRMLNTSKRTLAKNQLWHSKRTRGTICGKNSHRVRYLPLAGSQYYRIFASSLSLPSEWNFSS